MYKISKRRYSPFKKSNWNTATPQIVWEAFKAYIRGIYIKIGAWHKKLCKKAVDELTAEIAGLEEIHKKNRDKTTQAQLEQALTNLKLLEVKQLEIQVLFAKQRWFQVETNQVCY